MSTAPPIPDMPATPVPPYAVKRRFRNFLLDAPLQLKFTLYALLIAVIVSALLGAFLWRSTRALLQESEAALEARSQAVDTSRSLSTATLNNELMQRMNDPIFEKQLEARAAEIEARYEKEKAETVAQRAEIVRSQRAAWLAVVLCLLGFVGFVVLVSIVMTHRIAGPLFRVKQILHEISVGRLPQIPRPLRHGDQLHDLFDATVDTVKTLREQQAAELALAQRILDRCAAAGPGMDAATVKEVEEWKAKLQGRLSCLSR